MKPVTIRYRYGLDDGAEEVFEPCIDEDTLDLVSPESGAQPAWTRLSVHQCPHCPLRPEEHPHCPVAVNLVDLVSRLNLLASHDEMDVRVETTRRAYFKRTRAQEAISSLMGLLIAVSPCPKVAFFKPLARFHLPFSNPEETIWRATSVYMLSQYFRHRDGLPLDMDLAGLDTLYRDIQKLNGALSRRLRDACGNDCTLNAIVVLDVFAKSLPLVIDRSLERLRASFTPFLPPILSQNRQNQRSAAMPLLSIRYTFALPDGREERFDLRLDPTTLSLVSPKPSPYPDWTRLGFHQCPHCPLDPNLHPYCPVAVNVAELVSRFNRLSSHETMRVTVVTEERSYRKDASAQQGISSLMGLLIAASDCPITFFFKPLARFHLPFATAEDTIWRATSTYMLSQYFLQREGVPVDFEMKKLDGIYNDVQRLNQALAQRLRTVCERESTVNAVGILDIFAQSLPLVIDDSLEEIRPVFEPILAAFRRDAPR